jgi:hypothetical protein
VGNTRKEVKKKERGSSFGEKGKFCSLWCTSLDSETCMLTETRVLDIENLLLFSLSSWFALFVAVVPRVETI